VREYLKTFANRETLIQAVKVAALIPLLLIALACNAGPTTDPTPGFTSAEVTRVAKDAVARSHCLALLETLEFLEKGCRIAFVVENAMGRILVTRQGRCRQNHCQGSIEREANEHEMASLRIWTEISIPL